MLKENMHICPVCGYDKLEEVPYDEFGYPTYVICSCCGFEFGFDVESEGYTFSEYRQRWINQGFPFFNAKKKTSNWNKKTMEQQWKKYSMGKCK